MRALCDKALSMGGSLSLDPYGWDLRGDYCPSSVWEPCGQVSVLVIQRKEWCKAIKASADVGGETRGHPVFGVLGRDG